MSGMVHFADEVTDTEDGGKQKDDKSDTYQLEMAEEAQPKVTFVDPAGDRYDPQTKLE